ncbi:SurA N-terminal domain-containing protein, partial [Pelagibacteraceae bacterium]|nr:SurA N-terminal domain-containing protein [Pelagibacteraceae bacterium]
MLSSIRKFSTSIYAKILLGIVVIPFVFWGMGTSFRGGNKNVVVVIDEEKFSTKEFANFVSSYQNSNEEIDSEKIDQLLSAFIGNKLIEKEYNNFGIKLSDISLSKLIKIQKEFKSDNKFSRTQYEKFLITNNLDAVSFEKNMANQEKKKQLLNIIGGGIVPSKFMVNNIYNKINQKRKIELINLNDAFAKEFASSEDEIKSYFEKNKEKYIEIYKTVKILEINPNKLIGTNEFNDVFFKKLDEIHDSVIGGKKLDSIISEYNLEKADIYKINKLGEDINNNKNDKLPKELIENIFLLSDNESTSFVEKKDKYYVIEVFETENIQNSLENKKVLKKVKENLISLNIRKSMSEIIGKINQNNFSKLDFDNFSKNKNVPIQKISLESINDNKILKDGI